MNKLQNLKNMSSDREKVKAFLAHIGETDQIIINDVIHHCKTDPEARKYFVARHDEDILNIYQPQLHLVANAA